jgi:hypothetical protein
MGKQYFMSVIHPQLEFYGQNTASAKRILSFLFVAIMCLATSFRLSFLLDADVEKESLFVQIALDASDRIFNFVFHLKKCKGSFANCFFLFNLRLNNRYRLD